MSLMRLMQMIYKMILGSCVIEFCGGWSFMSQRYLKLFVKIAALEFAEALIIVACTRAYVVGSYTWTGVLEVAFVTNLFISKRITFDDERSRSWVLGYPAQLVGAVSGTLLGLLISMKVLGQ